MIVVWDQGSWLDFNADKNNGCLLWCLVWQEIVCAMFVALVHLQLILVSEICRQAHYRAASRLPVNARRSETLASSSFTHKHFRYLAHFVNKNCSFTTLSDFYHRPYVLSAHNSGTCLPAPNPDVWPLSLTRESCARASRAFELVSRTQIDSMQGGAIAS